MDLKKQVQILERLFLFHFILMPLGRHESFFSTHNYK